MGIWVAHNPQETLRHVRPVVEDARELGDLAEGVYREVRLLSKQAASEEAVSLFVATLRMPTLLFERLAERIEAVERDLDRRRRVEALGEPKDRPLHRATLHGHPAGPLGRPAPVGRPSPI